jgi:hypothetical protein
VYRADLEHPLEFGAAQVQGTMQDYLEKWVYSVGSHMEMLEKRVGLERLERLRADETHREGYHA